MNNRLIIKLTLHFVILLGSFASVLRADAEIKSNEILHILGWYDSELDPKEGNLAARVIVHSQIYESLLVPGKNHTLGPGQAKSWQVSADGKLYTIRLRDNIFWSDGMPVTARDFVTAMRRGVTDGAVSQAYTLGDIKNYKPVLEGRLPPESLGVTALSDTILQIELANRSSNFLLMLTQSLARPVPTHIIEKHGESWTDLDKIAVNGAYIPTRIIGPHGMEMEANPRYWDYENLAYKKLIISRGPLETKLVASIRADEQDVILIDTGIESNQVTQILKGEIFKTNAETIHVLALSTRNPALDDIRVRKAITIAMQREEIAKRITKGITLNPSYTIGLKYSGLDWSPPLPEWVHEIPPENRIKQARELMRQAGYGPQNRLKLRFAYSNEPASKMVANAVRSFLSMIYMDTETFHKPLPDHYVDAFNDPASFDILHVIWTNDFPHPSSAYLGVSKTLVNRVERPADINRYEEYIRQYRDALTRERQNEIMARFEKSYSDEFSIVPLLSAETKVVSFGGSNRIDMHGWSTVSSNISVKHLTPR